MGTINCLGLVATFLTLSVLQWTMLPAVLASKQTTAAEGLSTTTEKITEPPASSHGNISKGKPKLQEASAAEKWLQNVRNDFVPDVMNLIRFRRDEPKSLPVEGKNSQSINRNLSPDPAQAGNSKELSTKNPKTLETRAQLENQTKEASGKNTGNEQRIDIQPADFKESIIKPEPYEYLKQFRRQLSADELHEEKEFMREVEEYLKDDKSEIEFARNDEKAQKVEEKSNSEDEMTSKEIASAFGQITNSKETSSDSTEDEPHSNLNIASAEEVGSPVFSHDEMGPNYDVIDHTQNVIGEGRRMYRNSEVEPKPEPKAKASNTGQSKSLAPEGTQSKQTKKDSKKPKRAETIKQLMGEHGGDFGQDDDQTTAPSPWSIEEDNFLGLTKND